MVSQCQTIKKLWAGHESAQTDGQTDRRTDRQSDFYIPTELRSVGGIKNTDLYINKVYGAKTHIYLSTTIHYTIFKIIEKPPGYTLIAISRFQVFHKIFL